jgi:hypothetical protein
MYIERVRGGFWNTAVVTMCYYWKEVVKISLQGVQGDFCKTSQGEERRRRKERRLRVEEKDTLGSIVERERGEKR